MFIMNKIYLIIIIVFLLACTDSKIADIEKHFGENVTTISPQKIVDLEKYNIFDPWDILKFKKDYIFYNAYEPNGRFSVFIGNCDSVITGINQGNGPNDVSNYIDMHILNDSVEIFDGNYGFAAVLKYDKESIYIEKKSTICRTFTLGKALYDNKLILSPSLIDSCWIGLYTYGGHLLSHIDYIHDPVLSKWSRTDRALMFCNSVVAISPDKKNFICNNLYGGYLLFGQIDSTQIIQTKTYVYDKIRFCDMGRFFQNNKQQFLCSTASDNYAIVLYSGKFQKECGYAAAMHGGDVLFYDWNGNPQFRLKLSKPLIGIRYDKQDNIIYGICRENEPELVIYDMNGIIK